LAQATDKKQEFYWGTGRRKTAIARVRITRGKGKFIVNGREMKEFFVREQDRLDVKSPLQATKNVGKYDVFCTLTGGGVSGQAGAVVLGIARALLKAEPGLREMLQTSGFLTRDSRMKERKKYGQRGARARFQFSKR
jgi:small subunit ribosomal protein S9